MSLVGLLGSIAGFVRVRYIYDRANIDNAVFRLHYRFTSAFFFAACVIITAFDLIGSPIDCITDDSISRPEVINTYCWIQHTFTLPNGAARQPVVGGDMYQSEAFPNVGPEMFGSGKQQERRIHSYYQWVPFVLFLQGILFYLPHWIWKQHENGKIRNLTDGSRGQIIGPTHDDYKNRCATISEYLVQTMQTHGRFAFVHVLCELLNFINAVGNIYFINNFTGGTFLSYGSRVIEFSNMDQEERCDPMIEIFPRMTKCHFQIFGTSGKLEKFDALCMLPLNIVHEKIYIFLWFWLIILSILSALALIYRFVTLISPWMRIFVLQRQTSLNRNTAEAIVWKMPYGGYFLLNLLGKNDHSAIFKHLTDDLVSRLLHKNQNGIEGEDTLINPPRNILIYPTNNKPTPYSVFG
jgi:hypothetical protein